MVTVAEHNPAPIQRGIVIGSLDDKKRQVITIHTDGSVSGLRAGEGKGVNIMDMGKSSMMRVSDIEWDGEASQFCVKFLAGPLAGKYLTWAELLEAYPHLKDSPSYREIYEETGLAQIVGFRTYELAVEAEIAYFNAQRVAGKMTDTDKAL